MQGVRAAGEDDDAPLDESDSLQVSARLRLLWSDWRKLSTAQQRTWGDKQLGECVLLLRWMHRASMHNVFRRTWRQHS
jgi:hypothetical protein